MELLSADMTFFHPTRVPEVIMHQSILVIFACHLRLVTHMTNFSGITWPITQWSQVDDNLFNRYLRVAPLRVLCFSCQSMGI